MAAPKPNLYDINQDHVINIRDLVIAAKQFGQKGTNLSGDVNLDEVVDMSDLTLIAQNFNKLLMAAPMYYEEKASLNRRHFQLLRICWMC